MRKVFSSILALLVTLTLFAGPRSVEEAASIAAQFTNQQPQLNRMHKAPRQASSMRLAHKALQNNSEEAAFYVFNQEDGKGFVLVSADDRTADDVLGYSEKGSFDYNKINPNLRWWLSRYADEITALQTIDDSEFTDDPAVRKAKQVSVIAPFLVNNQGKEITWYQEAPYSNLCPMDQRDNTRCLTGCVATAASQIMYMWRWPEKGTGSSSYTWHDCKDDYCSQYWTKTLSANYGETTYDWDNMLPSYYGKSYTTAQATAVATLMSHAGIAAKMSYGGDAMGGSGAWTDDMGYALVTHFGYKLEKFISMYSQNDYKSAKGGNLANITCEFNVTRTQITNYFNADLEAGRPIIMGGEGDAGGHEFVCCGRDANNKFYINWGWEGDSNGYFSISSLRPGEYNFSSNLDAIIGLEPDKKDLPKVTVTWSVEGVTSTSEFTQGDALELPAAPADCGNGKVFVGWTAQSSVSGERPSDLFTSGAGKTVSEAVTYYAVFAKEIAAKGGSVSGTTTFKFSEIASANGWVNSQAYTTVTINPVTITATGGGNNGKWYTSGQGSWRMYSGGTVSIKVNGGDVTAVTSNPECDWTISNGEASFSPSGRTDFTQIEVVYGGGSSASYEDYSLECGGSEPVYYSIRFFDNGNQIGETQSVLRGTEAAKPADPKAACEAYTFVGWYTEALAESNTDKKEWVSNFKAYQDQDYYAIYSKTEKGEGSGAFDGTKGGTFKIFANVDGTKYYATGAVSSYKISSSVNESNAADYVFEKVEGGFTIKCGDSYIKYKDGTSLANTDEAYVWTIAAGVKGSWRVNSGTTDRALAYRAGTTLKFGGYSTTNIKLAEGNEYFDIEIGSADSGSTTYYSSTVNCSTTAIEQTTVAKPAAVKMIRNGQIVIVRGDAIYSITGARIQ